jgi:hypothetical protein
MLQKVWSLALYLRIKVLVCKQGRPFHISEHCTGLIESNIGTTLEHRRRDGCAVVSDRGCPKRVPWIQYVVVWSVYPEWVRTQISALPVCPKPKVPNHLLQMP